MVDDQGGGMVFRSVLRECELSIEARAIYSYLCGFAGIQDHCFPSVELMRKELKVSKSRFYKHMKQLIDAGIVSTKQERSGNKFSKTVYYLNHGEEQNARLEDLRNEGAIFEDTQEKPYSVPKAENPKSANPQNLATINNNLINNKSLINNQDNIYQRILDLLNQAKRKASSKGKLRISPVKWCVGRMIESGIPYDFILSEAQQFADQGKDIHTYKFEDLCTKKWRQQKRQ